MVGEDKAGQDASDSESEGKASAVSGRDRDRPQQPPRRLLSWRYRRGAGCCLVVPSTGCTPSLFPTAIFPQTTMSAAPSTLSLRRSSRLQTKATPTYADPEDEDEDSATSAVRRERKPPTKRPRKSAPADLGGPQKTPPKALGPKGRRRILSKLVDMPLDILYEVSA